MDTCPQCGYKEIIRTRRVVTGMNNYVSPKGNVACFNEEDKTITVGEVVWTLQTEWNKQQEAKALADKKAVTTSK